MKRLLATLGVSAVLTSMLTVGATAAAAAPTGEILGAGSADAIPGRYIVVLADGRRSVPALARELAGRFRGEVADVYQSALRGFSVRMADADARRLAADPAVAYVEADQRVALADTQLNPPSWGLDRIDQRALPLDDSYTYPTTASNVHAYVIDTGIRITHTDFGGRAAYGYDTVGEDEIADDCNGHGTHVAGTIGGTSYGVAKGVQLVAVRVFGCGPFGSTSNIVQGVDWVTANAIKPAVTNMSLGGSPSTAMDNAVRNSISSGITYGIAAGNGNLFGQPQDACRTSPARVTQAITVGATEIDDSRASFSNFGSCLDLFAPGVDITSAWKDSDTDTNTISGTSMATPHVVGAAALLLTNNPNATPAQVRNRLFNTATNGVVTDPRAGSPNKLLYVG